jgi:hypothetical protein
MQKLLSLGVESAENPQSGNHEHYSMKTLRIQRENPDVWYSHNVRQPVITPNESSQLIKYPPWCSANPLAYTSITSRLLSLLQRRKPQRHGGQGKTTHQGEQRSTKEAHHSRVSFCQSFLFLSIAVL